MSMIMSTRRRQAEDLQALLDGGRASTSRAATELAPLVALASALAPSDVRPRAEFRASLRDRLQNAALLDAVRALKPEQQECIVLRFLQGLSVAETAGVMSRTEGAIKQLQLRAVRALAKLLPEPVG